MTKYKLVFFDFDGVVLDSARIKTIAFPEVFANYPEHKVAITDYHLAHQGVSRYKKFEWIYANLLKQELSNERSQELGEEFSKIVLSQVLECKEIPGAEAFLSFLKEKNIIAVVASGTPYKELKNIIQLRGLSTYFIEVWGSPRKKVEIIDHILAKYDIAKSEALFLGDASTDFEAASARGVDFQAVYSPEMEEYWALNKQSTIKNLKELEVLFN